MDIVGLRVDLILAFLAGLATVTSPCALPFAPIILTYYLQDRRSTLGGVVGGITVLAGLATFALPFGLLITVFDVFVSPTEITPYFETVAGALLVIFGVLTVFNVRTPIFFPTPTLRKDTGYRTLYTLGFLYGLAGIGCTIWPFISVGVLASLSPIDGIVIYSTYLATVAAPVLIMGVFAAEIRDLVVKIVSKYSQWLRRGAGMALLGAGAYLLFFGLTFLEVVPDPYDSPLPAYELEEIRADLEGMGAQQ